MSRIETCVLAEEAGAWRHFLIQELHKKQKGEEYHTTLVSAGLRHLQRYCSDAAYAYFMGLYNGTELLMRRL